MSVLGLLINTEAKKYNITVYDPLGNVNNKHCNTFTKSYDTLKEARKALKKLKNYKRYGVYWYRYEIDFKEYDL